MIINGAHIAFNLLISSNLEPNSNKGAICVHVFMCMTLVLIVFGANLITCDIIHNYDIYFTTEQNVQFHDKKSFA